MLRLSALLLLLLAQQGIAASGLDAQRDAAAAERVQVEALRQKAAAMRQELDGLATRIAAQKEQRSEAVVRSAALDADLRRSQELSAALNALSQELARAEAQLAAADATLLEALHAEIRSTQEAAIRAPPEQRRALFERLRMLRAERQALRPQLPLADAPADGTASASEDPEDLLEQADALRDSEDKLRQRLASVQQRLREAREERALDERMNSFLGDESLFDEQDRRLRVVADGSGLRAADSEGFSGGERGVGDSGPVAVAEPGGSPLPAPPENAPGTVAIAAPPVVLEAGNVTVGSRAAPLSPEDEVRALEAEQRRLEALSKDLARRAAQLEDRARTLE